MAGTTYATDARRVLGPGHDELRMAGNIVITVMPGLVPRLSGSFFVDKAHGVDSSVLKRLATF